MSPDTTQLHVLPLGDPALGALRARQHHALFWFTKGQGRFTVAGRTRGFGANNALFVPAGVAHGFELAGVGQGSCVLWPTHLTLPLGEAPVHFRIMELSQQAELTQQIAALSREVSGQAPHAQMAAACLAALLAIWLDRGRDKHEAAWPPPDAAARLVECYCEGIEETLTLALSVGDRARALGVSPAHLTRSCRKTNGETAQSLLSARVMTEARDRLRDTSAPIKQIARDLGYGSAAYFSRCFQTANGRSPSAYRRGS